MPAVIVGEAEFTFGTDHAEGGHAAQFGLFDLQTAGQLRAHGSHRHKLPRRNIGRAAHNAQRRLSSRVHRADVQMVGIGMHVAGEHTAHHHIPDAVAGTPDFLQLQSQHGQAFTEFFRRALIGHEFP